MAEINVTPFVDVMLVLLIVFMVAAPLLTVGVPIDLPRDAGRSSSEGDSRAAHRLDRRRRQDLPAGGGGRRRRARHRSCRRSLQNGLDEAHLSCAATSDADYGTIMRVHGPAQVGRLRGVSALRRKRSRRRTAERCGPGSPSPSSATQRFLGFGLLAFPERDSRLRRRRSRRCRSSSSTSPK